VQKGLSNYFASALEPIADALEYQSQSQKWVGNGQPFKRV